MILFSEKIHTNRYIAIILITPLILFIDLLYNSSNNNDIILYSIILIIIVIIIFSILKGFLKSLWFEDKILIMYFPLFSKKSIMYNDIEEWHFEKIDALHEFKGWGIKKSKKFGRGYIADSQTIITLTLKNKTKFSFSVKNEKKIEHILTSKVKLY